MSESTGSASTAAFLILIWAALLSIEESVDSMNRATWRTYYWTKRAAQQCEVSP